MAVLVGGGVVDGDLREGDVDTGLVEGDVDVLADVLPDGPVVGDGDPHPDGEVDGAGAEVADADGGFVGFPLHLGLSLDDVPEHLLGLLEVGAVGHRGDHIEADLLLAGVVDEGLGGELAVGDDDDAAVEGAHDGVEDADFLDVALVGAALDVVAHLEGAHEEDDDAAGEVLEGALEGHADGEAHGAEQGDERGGLDADDVHGHDDDHRLEQHVDERREERLERGLGVAAVEAFDDEFFEHLGQLEADPEDEDGDEELGHEADGHLGEGAEAVLDDGVLAGDHGLEVGDVHVLQGVGHGGGDAVGGVHGLAELVGRSGGLVACGGCGQQGGGVVV